MLCAIVMRVRVAGSLEFLLVAILDLKVKVFLSKAMIFSLISFLVTSVSMSILVSCMLVMVAVLCWYLYHCACR